jgi:phage FluMu protein gp41
MPTYRVSKVSSSCRRLALATQVALVGEVANMPCSSCIVSQTLCLFSAHSTKCAKCVRKGVCCDGNFSVKDFDRLSAERLRLEQERQAALDRVAQETAEAASKVANLTRRIELVQQVQRKMIAREARSLEELDLKEEQQAQQASAGLGSVFDEQQLAAFFAKPLGLNSGGDKPQASQG